MKNLSHTPQQTRKEAAPKADDITSVLWLNLEKVLSAPERIKLGQIAKRRGCTVQQAIDDCLREGLDKAKEQFPEVRPRARLTRQAATLDMLEFEESLTWAEDGRPSLLERLDTAAARVGMDAGDLLRAGAIRLANEIEQTGRLRLEPATLAPYCVGPGNDVVTEYLRASAHCGQLASSSPDTAAAFAAVERELAAIQQDAGKGVRS